MFNEDAQFIDAIHANFDDETRRAIYADWLEERGDPRGEYLRLEQQLRTIPLLHEDVLALRQRWFDLRSEISPDWFGLIGSYCASPDDLDLFRIKSAAATLERRVRYVDADDYTCEITAAAENGHSHALAYVESRQRQVRPDFLDITFHLHIRDTANQRTAWEVESYNPFFGCDVRFLEWFGNTALIIYREKHRTYVCRFGLLFPAKFVEIGDYWLMDGPQLTYWDRETTQIFRFAVPSLTPLPPMAEETAERWGLVPNKSW